MRFPAGSGKFRDYCLVRREPVEQLPDDFNHSGT